MATPQWWQTPNMVIASMKLTGISPDKIQGAVLVLMCTPVEGESLDEYLLPSSPLHRHSFLPFSLSSLFVCERVHILEIQAFSLSNF